MNLNDTLAKANMYTKKEIRNNKKNVNGQTKGITLIALVITIIVLLILAGITINLTLGEEGIIRKAEQAGKNYVNVANAEQEQLAGLTNTVDAILENVLNGNTTTEPTYTMVDGVPVPNGFTHIEGTKETGFVIKNDTDGNEYVWVPVDGMGYNYDRYALLSNQPADGIDETTNSIKIKQSSTSSYYYVETMPKIDATRTELDSVTKYGGFYIGRYEVGVEGYDTSISTSNSGNLTNWTGYTNGTPVVQAGKQVWNYVTRDKAKEISEGMYSNLNSVTSRLCSSYAWDTALKFIETQNSTYLTNSVGGNYSTASGGTGKLSTTGYDTTHPCNIYDMGGNAWEWSTESYSYTSNPYITRGGCYAYNSNTYPAASRSVRK